MSSDTDRLEREAETHRSNLDSTFDAIRDRLSVGQIVDEFSGYLKEGQGADTVKNLGRQVRDNPLALGLVGAGLAWLLLGEGTRAKTHEASDRLARWREDREYDRFDEAFPADDRRYAERTEAGRTSFASSGAGGGSSSASPAATSGSSSSGMGDRLSRAVGSAGEAGSNAASSVSDTAKGLGRSVSDATGSAADATTRGMHDARDAMSSAGSATMESARRTGRQAYRAGSRAQRNVADLIHDEPFVFGAVALAIGAAVGAMLPATRQEDEWMGEARDHVRDEVFEQGRDTLHKAEHVAGKAYEAASETAEDKGLKPETNDAGSQTVAQKVSGVAEAAGGKAREEAKREGLL